MTRDVEQLELSLGKEHVCIDLGCRKLFLNEDEARGFAGRLDRMACELARRHIEQPPGSIRRIHFLRAGLPLCGFSQEVPREWPEGHRWASIDDDEAKRHLLACQACLAAMRAL